MKTNRSKTRLILDIGMYAGFTLMFFLNLTGVIVHQWLGLVVGAIAIYHLLDHWDWVSAVSKRYFGKTSWQARLYYLVDAGILMGFLGILVSGLGISTWFSVLVENQVGWIDFHVVISAVTLLLIVIKVIAHRRWIVKTAAGWFSPAPAVQKPRTTPQPVKETGNMDRRDFLKLAGMVGVAAVVALLNIADSVADAAVGTEEIAGTEIVSATDSTTEGISSDVSSIAAYCRSCRKGKHCSFPGECRSYQDSDGNGLCDLGECA
jgi:hypothetical protein